MKKYILTFENFSQERLESVDKAPDRIKAYRNEFYSKPPKAVYLKTMTPLVKKVLSFLEKETEEKELFLIKDSVWLIAYTEKEGKVILERGDIESLPNLEFKITKLAFKEFNIYRVDAHDPEKSGTHYSLQHTSWFINKKDAKFKDNLKSLTRSFGLSSQEEESSPKPSWAIMIAKNPYRHSDAHYGWLANDGSDGEILDSKEFRKIAKKSADTFASKKFYEHMGGEIKIYTNKQKFIEDFKKLSGSAPAV